MLGGRRILVTGGSSGIGRGLVRAYAAHGAEVWAVGRRAAGLDETTAGCPADRVHVVAADLTTDDGRSKVAAAIRAGGDLLDVAVHAAGLLGPPGTPLAEYPSDAWYAVFEANVSAMHFLHQRLLPCYAGSASPTVIGVSSSVGRKGRAGWGMYAVSKFAVEGWLEVLADEWRGTGRVYSVNPGGTATPMRATAMPQEDPSTIPSPEDIAPIFLRLAWADCPEPTGTKFEARDWMGRDPFE